MPGGLIALLIWGAECGRRRSWYRGRSVAGKGAGHADGDHAAPDGTGAVR